MDWETDRIIDEAMGISIIKWEMYFRSDKKFHEFLKESEKIEEMERKPEKIYDIYEYCPVRTGTYYLEDEDGKLRIELLRNKHQLLGKESWLPFLARYIEGEFKVEGEFLHDCWGARLKNGGYKDLKVVEEWR